MPDWISRRVDGRVEHEGRFGDERWGGEGRCRHRFGRDGSFEFGWSFFEAPHDEASSGGPDVADVGVGSERVKYEFDLRAFIRVVSKLGMVEEGI